MLKSMALGAIRLYQRRVSPHKGFSCAYRVHAQGASCSNYGHRVIERHGLWLGLRLLRRRLEQCAWHQHRHRVKPAIVPGAAAPGGFGRRQAGFVDPGCDDGCGCGPGCAISECGLAEHCACDACEIGACWVALGTCSGGACGGGRRREDWRRAERAQRRSRFGPPRW
ncbi:MAG: membrane protein insertion efficiency factor YidD [Janthinobacterium lividum]